MVERCYLRQVKLFVEFEAELSAALQGKLDLSGLKSFEDEMVAVFVNPDPTMCLREGTQKCCLNYLLLDPRVTQNLPVITKTIGLSSDYVITV